jgi:probable F420-dependent oxidoreductase
MGNGTPGGTPSHGTEGERRPRSLKVGVVFPQTSIGNDPGAVREYALGAEALGYSHILAFDHVLGAVHAGRDPQLWGPYDENSTFHEPLTLFSYFAALTSEIGFLTGVLVLPQRQTALVAKQAAEVAILSENRLRLGVGVGWNYVEYEALGQRFGGRGKYQEEQIAVLRELLSVPVVDFSGKYHRIDRAGLAPLPSEPVPIWLGGFSDATLERAAQIADGFVFSRYERDGGVRRAAELARALRADVDKRGRDAEAFGIEGRVLYERGEQAALEALDTLRAADFDYVTVDMLTSDLRTPQEHLDALAEYAKVIGLDPNQGRGAANTQSEGPDSRP